MKRAKAVVVIVQYDAWMSAPGRNVIIADEKQKYSK
jgi:hypothetical protein